MIFITYEWNIPYCYFLVSRSIICQPTLIAWLEFTKSSSQPIPNSQPTYNRPFSHVYSELCWHGAGIERLTCANGVACVPLNSAKSTCMADFDPSNPIFPLNKYSNSLVSSIVSSSNFTWIPPILFVSICLNSEWGTLIWEQQGADLH